MNSRLTVTHESSLGCVIHSDLCDRRLLDTFVNEGYARVICIRFSPTYLHGWVGIMNICLSETWNKLRPVGAIKKLLRV